MLIQSVCVVSRQFKDQFMTFNLFLGFVDFKKNMSPDVLFKYETHQHTTLRYTFYIHIYN